MYMYIYIYMCVYMYIILFPVKFLQPNDCCSFSISYLYQCSGEIPRFV